MPHDFDIAGRNRRLIEAAHATVENQRQHSQAAYLTIAGNIVSAVAAPGCAERRDAVAESVLSVGHAPMIRSILIAAVGRNHPELKPAEVVRVVACIFEEITEQFVKGGRVESRGFGTFCTRARDGRTRRNLRIGDAVPVKAKRVPHFTAGLGIAGDLNIRIKRPLT